LIDLANCSIRNINSNNVKSETIQIRYDGKTEFKEYLAKIFSYTYNLIENKNEEEIDEYMEFYKGKELNTFHVKIGVHKKINKAVSNWHNLFIYGYIWYNLYEIIFKG